MHQSHYIIHESNHNQHPTRSITNQNTYNRHNNINILNGNNNNYVKLGIGKNMDNIQVKKKIQEAKMTIWKWIKFRENSDECFYTSTRREKTRREAGIGQDTTQSKIRGSKKGLMAR